MFTTAYTIPGVFRSGGSVADAGERELMVHDLRLDQVIHMDRYGFQWADALGLSSSQLDELYRYVRSISDPLQPISRL